MDGPSRHIDFNPSCGYADFAKAFAEFLLVSGAAEAWLYVDRKFRTYPSNFPRYAARLGNVPFATFGP